MAAEAEETEAKYSEISQIILKRLKTYLDTLSTATFQSTFGRIAGSC